jgi:hypothetical protein
VTRTTQFDSNDTEMAEVSVSGSVTTGQLTGSVAVMARYQGNVGVFRATIPLGIATDKLPPAKSFVDELVFKKLKALGLPSSQACDDATFLRRVSIDIAGRLPTLEETEQFIADPSAAKRENLVNRLLDSTDYADYFANKWSAILRNKRRLDAESKEPERRDQQQRPTERCQYRACWFPNVSAAVSGGEIARGPLRPFQELERPAQLAGHLDLDSVVSVPFGPAQ